MLLVIAVWGVDIAIVEGVTVTCVLSSKVVLVASAAACSYLI